MDDAAAVVRQKRIVGTVKKATEIVLWRWFSRKVLQV
jgi:hypothetical protein